MAAHFECQAPSGIHKVPRAKKAPHCCGALRFMHSGVQSEAVGNTHRGFAVADLDAVDAEILIEAG
jgi:hypothetical protein